MKIKKVISLLIVMAMIVTMLPANVTTTLVQAADINNIGSPSYRLVNTMDGSESFVYEYNVMDYGADNTGNADNTEIFQKLLNKVGQLGGGTVYVPKGKYVVKGSLSIPRGVVLRGDWTTPNQNQALPEGTVLMAYTGRNGNERTTPFIEMCIESGVMDMTIWYPEQDPNNIVPYSPTIRYGWNNYFGNEYCNTKNVTFVNSYIGILFNYDNGGASPVINNVYGTTLKKGIEIDRIVDVGRIDGVHFSADYWINSGYSNAPTNTDSFRNYMKENSIGIVMRRNDWSYACDINIDGYHIGYDTENTLASGENSAPNGHHYKFNLTDCTNGIVVNATNSVGILFEEVNIENCKNGIVVNDGTSDVVQFMHTTIDASRYALRTSSKSSTKVLFNESTVNRGQVAINGGVLTATNCAFNNKGPQIYFGLSGRGMLTNCSFKEGRNIKNESVYEISINGEATPVQSVSTFPEVKFDSHTPARRVLYNATSAPYYASTGSNDNTSAIQNALNAAANDGGGIVYLPAGKYKVRGHLTIPANVELRGALDIQTVPHGGGTILEAYENRGNENGDSFIQLKANSGIRGIVVDYPEQVFDGTDSWKPAAYPYTIQGQGDNVYVINTSVRASYKALDLFTYQCNNHYVDFLGGHAFNVGVKVGNNSQNGKIYNLMFNVIVYACGNESKFGSFSNMPNGVSNAPLYNYSLNNLEFLILGDCDNEILYNDFHYGSYRGLVLQNDGNGGPSGKAMGFAIDGAIISVEVGSGTTKQFDLYNTQVVATGNGPVDKRYYQLDSGSSMRVNLYNSDYWGQPVKGIVSSACNTALTLYGAHFENPGDTSMGSLAGGTINVISSNVNQRGSNFLDIGNEGNMAVYNSNANNRSNSTSAFKVWINNQAYGTISSSGILATISRNGWSAIGSNNNGNAYKALDSNIETRWDTATSQVPGQWFTVDMGSQRRFNTLILDVGASTGDHPNAYEVYVSDDNSNWGSPIASGKTTNGIITFSTQYKRYIRVVQTGNQGGYWSIHEFYALEASEGNDLPNGEVASNSSSSGSSSGGSTSSSDNIALGKTVTQSSAEADGMSGQYAVDGDKNTRWASSWSDDEWITVDLGKTYSVNKAVLYWEGAYASAYKILVSIDGSNWTTVKSLTGQDGGTDTVSFDAVNARYVRMQGVTRGLPYGYSLYEFEVYGGAATSSGSSSSGSGSSGSGSTSSGATATGNIASGKTITCSGTENDSFPASNAVDGNTETRWSSNWADDAWITVNLGKTYAVNKVVLKWEGAYGTDYKIQTSTNGSSWTTVKSLTGQDGGTDTITFDATDARYVRMQGVTRALPYGYSLWEMEVYAEDSSSSSSSGTYGVLSKGKNVSASGSENDSFPASNAVDGNTGTRWSSNWADNAWITVDLGATYTVDKVELNWEGAYGSAYNIQTSTDGNNWTTVRSLTGQDGGIDTVTFNATSARYVRMQGVTRALPYGYSLWEMNVYGR